MSKITVKEVKERVIADNDAVAVLTANELREKKIFFVNLMASPGAGKTSTLLQTVSALKDDYRIGVMEADVDSTVDAEALAAEGVRVVQLHTGGACHMDADMTRRGLETLGLDGLDMVFLENVGNLVCPAEFDVGAAKKVMILSVPEGDDKPLKYPLMFQVSDCLLINKIDAMPAFDFSVERLKGHLKKINPTMTVIPVSAKTGEGFDEWIGWLKEEATAQRER